MGMQGKSKKVKRSEFRRIQVVEKEPETENHMQMFARLVRAGDIGIHNPPSPNPKRAK